MKLLRCIIVLTLIASIHILGTSQQDAQALSGSEFKAGRIIDDIVFTNKFSMSSAQIQRFLESKVAGGACDVAGTRPSTRWNAAANRYYTHAEWGALNGNPAPFVCLTNYRENPTTKQTNLGNPNVPIEGAQTAAEIIYNAGQQYNINPQVLIVLLQKEQSLITDDWPWASQYSAATGAYCPDTAACDATKAGFGTQVREAARLFRYYMDSPFLYFVGNNYVRYNPNVSCGGTTLYIENLATEALYHYTPYQPNQAALNNLYGTGDACSAYGNRNFWRLFNEWFGSTLAPEYAAQPIEQSAYPTIKQGQKAAMYIKYLNTGKSTWYDSVSAGDAYALPVRLGTDNALNRNSAFSKSWYSPNRPATTFARVYDKNGQLSANQHVVLPGEVAEFWFSFDTTYNIVPGTYTEAVRPIIEGYGPMNTASGAFFNVSVTKAEFTATPVKQSGYPSLYQGQTHSLWIDYKNTGNVTWYDETSATSNGEPPIRLATDAALNRTSVFSHNWLLGSTRPSHIFSKVFESDGTTLAANQHIVQVGQIARFAFDIRVPTTLTPAVYNEFVRPIVEGVGPMNETGTFFAITVSPLNYAAVYADQSPYPVVTKGTSTPAYIRYKNTGTTPWYDAVSASIHGMLPVRLATNLPINKNSNFGSTWPFASRPALTFGKVLKADGSPYTTNPNIVMPGEYGEFWFSFTAPPTAASGAFIEGVRPIIEGYGPMNDTGTYFGVTVP